MNNNINPKEMENKLYKYLLQCAENPSMIKEFKVINEGSNKIKLSLSIIITEKTSMNLNYDVYVNNRQFNTVFALLSNYVSQMVLTHQL